MSLGIALSPGHLAIVSRCYPDQASVATLPPGAHRISINHAPRIGSGGGAHLMHLLAIDYHAAEC